MRSNLRLLPFALMACSGPSATPAAPTDASVEAAPDAPRDGCERWAAASCAYGYRCGWYFDVKFVTEAECREDQVKQCRASLSQPGVIVPVDHEPCTTALETAKCNVPIPECKSRPGTLPEGSACDRGAQCASALCQLDESLCGTCRTRPIAGGSCDKHFECAGGETELMCDLETRRCVSRRKLGEACAVFGCEMDLSCVANVCVRNAKAGEACSDSSSSDPTVPMCSGDVACVAGTCKPYSVVKVGEPCDAARVCRGASRCNGRECVATKALGESCTKVTECAWWATCSEGKCVAGFSVCLR